MKKRTKILVVALIASLSILAAVLTNTFNLQGYKSYVSPANIASAGSLNPSSPLGLWAITLPYDQTAICSGDVFPTVSSTSGYAQGWPFGYVLSDNVSYACGPPGLFLPIALLADIVSFSVVFGLAGYIILTKLRWFNKP